MHGEPRAARAHRAMAAAARLPMFRLQTWCVVGDVMNQAKAAARVVKHLEAHVSHRESHHSLIPGGL